MYNIVLDTTNVFVYSSVIDASIDVFTNVLMGEATSKVMAFSLIHLLVMVVCWSMSTTFAAGITTTAVTMSLSVVVVVVVLLFEGIRRVIAALGARSW